MRTPTDDAPVSAPTDDASDFTPPVETPPVVTDDASAADAPDFTPPVETPPVVSALERFVDRIPVAAIQEVWIFPPRRAGGVETSVVVLAVDEDGPLLRILTASYSASRDRKGRLEVELATGEHGAAAPERISRVIDGVLRRMDDSLPAHPPRHERLGGDPIRWAALLESLRSSPPAVARSGGSRYR